MLTYLDGSFRPIADCRWVIQDSNTALSIQTASISGLWPGVDGYEYQTANGRVAFFCAFKTNSAASKACS